MEVAYFMSTKIGKLQFLKDNDTTFDLTKDSWEDTDEFICDNYKNEMKELVSHNVYFIIIALHNELNYFLAVFQVLIYKIVQNQLSSGGISYSYILSIYFNLIT